MLSILEKDESNEKNGLLFCFVNGTGKTARVVPLPFAVKPNKEDCSGTDEREIIPEKETVFTLSDVVTFIDVLAVLLKLFGRLKKLLVDIILLLPRTPTLIVIVFELKFLVVISPKASPSEFGGYVVGIG
jgi:hypothetical protein